MIQPVSTPFMLCSIVVALHCMCCSLQSVTQVPSSSSSLLRQLARVELSNGGGGLLQLWLPPCRQRQGPAAAAATIWAWPLSTPSGRSVCVSDPGMLLPLFICSLNLSPLQFVSTDLWVVSRKKSLLWFLNLLFLLSFIFFYNLTLLLLWKHWSALVCIEEAPNGFCLFDSVSSDATGI